MKHDDKNEGKVRVRLLEVLAEERMKMAELSRRSGLAYSTINKLANENTDSVSLKTLYEICKVLNRVFVKSCG